MSGCHVPRAWMHVLSPAKAIAARACPTSLRATCRGSTRVSGVRQRLSAGLGVIREADDSKSSPVTRSADTFLCSMGSAPPATAPPSPRSKLALVGAKGACAMVSRHKVLGNTSGPKRPGQGQRCTRWGEPSTQNTWAREAQRLEQLSRVLCGKRPGSGRVPIPWSRVQARCGCVHI